MTPTDRELLERAAKAAGIDVRWIGVWHDYFVHHPSMPPIEWLRWNPLTNNSDAFALMVRMGFSVKRMNGCVEIYGETHTHDYQMLAYEDYVAMPGNHEITEAATRRAITRAAVATATEKGE